MNNIIEIKNLTKEYPGFKLNNIDLVIPYGSIMGLVGENGAGKTTLIKIILNIVNLIVEQSVSLTKIILKTKK